MMSVDDDDAPVGAADSIVWNKPSARYETNGDRKQNNTNICNLINAQRLGGAKAVPRLKSSFDLVGSKKDGFWMMYCKGSKSTQPHSLDVRAKCIISGLASEQQLKDFDNVIQEFGHRIDDIFFLRNSRYQIDIICDKLKHASVCIVDDKVNHTDMSIERFTSIIDKYSKTFRCNDDRIEDSKSKDALSIIQSIFSIKSSI